MKVRLILLGLLCQATLAVAAPIKVDVDRKTVRLNESFRITFSTSEDPDGNPDFTPLEKEFEVIDRNHGSNSTWINGASNTTIQWTFDVMAKHTGKVTIPALHFGSETSPPLSISVTEDGSAPDVANNDADLFLEVTATPKQPYVQSQILYTVRIFTRVKIAEGKLADPEVADAVVTKLGEDKNYALQVKGTNYVVVERNYAIFPQKSGTLTIPAMNLTAAIMEDDQSGFGGFFGARATRTERVSSKATKLNVLPAPAAFAGRWLAAQQLVLKQQWSGDVLAMRVGEPLTRTLTLIAKGATVGQLPKLQQAGGSEDLKSYPDQPKLDEQKTAEGILATREEKIAFIPAKAGTYTLPAVEIPWFNVQTQQTERATIPAVTVIATGVGKVATPPAATAVDKSVEKPVYKPAIINTPISTNPSSWLENLLLWQGLAGFFALAWLLTLRKLAKKRSKPTAAPLKKPDDALKNIAFELKQACAYQDIKEAGRLLLLWGQKKYAVRTLGELTRFCDARLSDEVAIVNQILYGKPRQKWDSKKLYQAFCEHQAMEKAKPKVADDKLEPLHRL